MHDIVPPIVCWIQPRKASTVLWSGQRPRTCCREICTMSGHYAWHCDCAVIICSRQSLQPLPKPVTLS